MRRFAARAAAVALSVSGLDAPKPLATRRSGSSPRATSASRTEAARLGAQRLVQSGVPDVVGVAFDAHSGRASPRAATASLSSKARLAGWMSALPLANRMRVPASRLASSCSQALAAARTADAGGSDALASGVACMGLWSGRRNRGRWGGKAAHHIHRTRLGPGPGCTGRCPSKRQGPLAGVGLWWLARQHDVLARNGHVDPPRSRRRRGRRGSAGEPTSRSSRARNGDSANHARAARPTSGQQAAPDKGPSGRIASHEEAPGRLGELMRSLRCSACTHVVSPFAFALLRKLPADFSLCAAPLRFRMKGRHLAMRTQQRRALATRLGTTAPRQSQQPSNARRPMGAEPQPFRSPARLASVSAGMAMCAG